MSFLKAEPSLDELADFTPMFAIRSLETGISLSPFRKTSKRLEDQNWFLKEIVANDKLKLGICTQKICLLAMFSL